MPPLFTKPQAGGNAKSYAALLIAMAAALVVLIVWGLVSSIAGSARTDYLSGSQVLYDTSDADYAEIRKSADSAAAAWVSMAYANDEPAFTAGRKAYLSFMPADSELAKGYGRLAFKAPESRVTETKITGSDWSSFPYWREKGGSVRVSYVVTTDGSEPIARTITLVFGWTQSGDKGEWKVIGDTSTR